MLNWARFRIAFQASAILILCCIVVWWSAPQGCLLRNSSSKRDSPSLPTAKAPDAMTSSTLFSSNPAHGTRCSGKDVRNPANNDSKAEASESIQSIMNPTGATFERLASSPVNKTRYNGLQSVSRHIRYFFAVNLLDCPPMLPILFGTIVQTIEYLKAESCALSIVETCPQDSTRPLLRELRAKIESLGTAFYHRKSSLVAGDGRHDRIATLAKLRSRALDPILRVPSLFKLATIVFVNDLIRCGNDLLEILYQQAQLKADITCTMDWIHNGILYYDIWAARGLSDNRLTKVSQESSRRFGRDLFWSASSTQKRFAFHKSFQVHAYCNGIATLDANPVLRENIRFQAADEDESYNLFCKDFWKRIYTKIQIVRSVNVPYNGEELEQDCQPAGNSA
jgi:hypothetical protein